MAGAVAFRHGPAPRPRFALSWADGATLELGASTRVLGVLNVTPDSFSDGGRHLDPERAVAAAGRMLEAGADVIDVGGESTRPGAESVAAEAETERVLPVIEAIVRRHGARVSIDTMKAEVARRAVDAGASLINDVSAASEPEMLQVAARHGVPIALMHMRGNPRTMQRDTDYDDLLGEVGGFLRKRARKCVEAGLSSDKIIVDPGIGFGKALGGNLLILRQLPSLRGVGLPILIGASRKTFIGAALDLPVSARLEGSLAVAAIAAWNGAHMIRAHDVTETLRVVRMVDAIRNG